MVIDIFALINKVTSGYRNARTCFEMRTKRAKKIISTFFFSLADGISSARSSTVNVEKEPDARNPNIRLWFLGRPLGLAKFQIWNELSTSGVGTRFVYLVGDDFLPWSSRGGVAISTALVGDHSGRRSPSQ